MATQTGFHDLHGIVKKAQKLLTEMTDQGAPKHIAVFSFGTVSQQ
jgi:hypothetical protein